MATLSRPLFRRTVETWIAVRPIRLGADKVIEPGEKVDLPIHRLRSLYRRRRIGPAGHPWTERVLGVQMLGFPKATFLQVEAEEQEAEEQEAEEQEAEEQEAEAEEQKAEPEKIGSQWYIPGNDRGFTSRKKALEWLDGEAS